MKISRVIALSQQILITSDTLLFPSYNPPIQKSKGGIAEGVAMQPTFDQAFQLLNIARESGASLETLQAVFQGFLPDLLKAEKLPNRDEFRKLLGLDPSVFIVKMGGTNNTDEITAALGFPFNDWITQKNFPLKPSENPTEDVIEIVDPGKDFSEEEGLAFLKEKGLLRPTYEHAIRFDEQFGKATTSETKPYVIFLHEAWRGPIRRRRFVYLDRSPEYRVLYLLFPVSRFSGHCVLAGVRPRK